MPLSARQVKECTSCIADRIWNLNEAMAPAMPRNPKKGADPKPKDEGQPARQQPAEKATKNQKADKSQKEQKSPEKPTAEQKQNETAPKEQKQAEKAQTQPKVADKAPAEKQQGKNQKEQKQAEKPQQEQKEQKEQKQQDKDGKQPDKKPDVKQQSKKQNGKQLDKKQDNKQQDRMQDAKLQVQKQDQSQTQQGLLQEEQKLQVPSDVPQLLTKASKDRLPVRSPINPGEATPVIDMLQSQKQEERPSKKRKEPEKDSRLSNTAWEEFLMLDSKSAAQAPLAQERGLANQEPLASSLRAPQTLEEKRAQLKEQLMAEGVHVSPARVEKEENLETKMRLACT